MTIQATNSAIFLCGCPILRARAAPAAQVEKKARTVGSSLIEVLRDFHSLERPSGEHPRSPWTSKVLAELFVQLLNRSM
jgi:hypothetical protein